MNSFPGRYLGGHPRSPEPADNAVLTVSKDGVRVAVDIPARVVFTTVMEAPHTEVKLDAAWLEISGVHAEGPDELRQRFTATRIALLGPFALALPKKVKSECYVVVEGDFGEFYFAVRRGTVQELRAELAPWASYATRDTNSALPPARDAVTHESRGSLLEAVRELVALRERGALTEEEFLLAKADLFSR